MSRPDPRVVEARYNNGQPLDTFTSDERATLRGLMLQSVAYRDPQHPDHAVVVANAGELYRMDTPEAEE